MSKIELINHPPQSETTELYRTVFVVEVLSNEPLNHLNLNEVAYEICEGDASGRHEVLDHRKISKEDMTKLLLEQRSDPSFLIVDEDS